MYVQVRLMHGNFDKNCTVLTHH